MIIFNFLKIPLFSFYLAKPLQQQVGAKPLQQVLSIHYCIDESYETDHSILN